MEAQGVDFWWLDWQQGESTSMRNLDPLLWLNHLHFQDSTRRGKRPMLYSRWGGLGNHRYPIGFSGDTYATWDSLRFLPYFTATAANVQSDTYRSFEVYIVVAVVYLALSMLYRFGFWAIGLLLFTRKRRLGTAL